MWGIAYGPEEDKIETYLGARFSDNMNHISGTVDMKLEDVVKDISIVQDHKDKLLANSDVHWTGSAEISGKTITVTA